ncbi:calcium-binding protein, partial [Microvirga sp. 2TAF3]
MFDTKPNKKTNLDTITDFNVKDDTIWLDNAVFKKLGKGSEAKPGQLAKGFFTIGDKAKDKDDYLIYNKKTGVLSYDADGSGKGTAVEIAKLSKNL